MTIAEKGRGSPGRRWWRWGAGAVAATIGGVALLWFVWLPRYRPALRAGERYGVDVSSHQGQIEWNRVAGDDIDFAYIKATEGGDFTDDRFVANWEGAGRAGVDRGAYHFFTLCTPGDVQAAHFLSVVPVDGHSLPPAVDLEIAGNCRERPDGEELQRELDQFVRIVGAATVQRVILYVGDDFEARYPVRDRLDNPLWHPRFLRRPNVERWILWQVMGFAHIEGIDGDVDLDVMQSLP